MCHMTVWLQRIFLFWFVFFSLVVVIFLRLGVYVCGLLYVNVEEIAVLFFHSSRITPKAKERFQPQKPFHTKCGRYVAPSLCMYVFFSFLIQFLFVVEIVFHYLNGSTKIKTEREIEWLNEQKKTQRERRDEAQWNIIATDIESPKHIAQPIRS